MLLRRVALLQERVDLKLHFLRGRFVITLRVITRKLPPISTSLNSLPMIILEHWFMGCKYPSAILSLSSRLFSPSVYSSYRENIYHDVRLKRLKVCCHLSRTQPLRALRSSSTRPKSCHFILIWHNLSQTVIAPFIPASPSSCGCRTGDQKHSYFHCGYRAGTPCISTPGHNSVIWLRFLEHVPEPIVPNYNNSPFTDPLCIFL